VEVIRSGMADLHVSTLECQDKEHIEEVKIKAENKMLSYLSVYTTDNVPAKAFVKKLVE
jgi:hypothetical protein